VTIHKGVSLLADEGIIYKKRGVGMFVSPQAPELLRSRGRQSFKQDYLEPLLRQATTLGLGNSELHALLDEAQKEAQQETTTQKEPT
jgi:DNA-binding transcriptional regulator YhcF (GntR family)